ncbi:hypothetical protein CVD28_11175 [Bacillus sp. M6-12]|uniref:GNAT family N-acetyltransferase n=1 Tax=Bacillus sp. M6-12 TaxID=2054166 RepID=UPI000C772093|nr:GNAT family N-acetyltransferase [Bacillus sp. M6-12]PLS17554.1 hypothetical protein CVD28_11175 [Bacillus sp. M6-12]
MKLITYSDDLHTIWEDFVQNSRNGTFMQQRTFLNYHPAGKFEDCSTMVYDGQERLIAVIPAAVKNEGDNPVFCSYPGASHGGIIVNHIFDTSDALELIPMLMEHCRSLGFNAIELKMVPRIYHSWNCDEIDFSLRYNGFASTISELATALPLKDISIAEQNMDKKTIRNKNKALSKGVTIHESKDFLSYWEILEKNLKEKHQAQPTHTYTEVLDLIERFPNKIKLFAAFYDGRMIAGVVVFLLNSRVINCFYICHDNEYQHLRPLNLVFFELVKFGMQEGFHYVDWGISTESKGTIVNSGLFRFKEGFGGRGILREAYRLNL